MPADNDAGRSGGLEEKVLIGLLILQNKHQLERQSV